MAENPEEIAKFTEEAIRMYGVVNTPRLVVKDHEIGDAKFKEGEMVLNLLCVGSRDPQHYSKPNILDIDRGPVSHLTFSKGPHLCIGHILGRTEITILTEEWLKRIPKFKLVANKPHAFRLGTVMALDSMELSW